MNPSTSNWRSFRVNRGNPADWVGEMKPPEDPDLPAFRVLVVDDIPTNQKILKHMVQRMGLQADVCGSGKEAVNLCQKNRYDLVLMDLHMPEMSGFEAGEIILGQRKGRLPLLYAQTADETEEACMRTREIGFDGHMTKPLRPQGVRKVLEGLLSRIRSA